ncbi:MAG: TMEM165/GDT1 family protein, partial [Methanophagales archaeon]|nr:TMEM165/GDT1 family protein [Methanophagales archaeon]
MVPDILIPLIVVGLAELGDKTQLSTLLLASKTEKHLHLLLGVILAFLIVDGIAILAGEWITYIAPGGLIKMLSGAVFIIFGLVILIFRNRREETKSKYYFENPFYSGFIMIFVSEWGDKTQIAAGLFATKYSGLMVLTGVIFALSLLSIIAIYSGKIISDKVNRETLAKIAGISFILMGVAFFF